MKQFKLSSGHAIPSIGLGTWKSENQEAFNAVSYAIEVGYRHIDCAAIYGNETEIGNALSAAFSSKKVQREEIFITSKLWNNAHASEAVEPALQKTLSDLNIDYLDLYLIHWPVALKPGVTLPSSAADFIPLSDIPISQTWQAMEQCVAKGLIRSIGVSNFSIAHLTSLLESCSIPPAVNQVELHPYLTQDRLLSFCERSDIHLTAYAPLGSYDRPDRLRQLNEPTLLDNPVILSIAAAHSVTPAQVLIAWAVQRGTSVIPKSVTPARIASNFEAKDLVLPETQIAEISELDQHFRFVSGDFWCSEGSPYSIDALWGES